MRQTSNFQSGQRHRCQGLAEKVVPVVITLVGMSPLPWTEQLSGSLCTPEQSQTLAKHPCPSLPGLLALQILLGFQPHGEHVLGMDAAEGWEDRQT